MLSRKLQSEIRGNKNFDLVKKESNTDKMVAIVLNPKFDLFQNRLTIEEQNCESSLGSYRSKQAIQASKSFQNESFDELLVATASSCKQSTNQINETKFLNIPSPRF